MAMEFAPKFRPLGRVMGKLMMRPKMRKIFDHVLSGMAHHAVAGEEIGKDWIPTVANIGGADARTS
jgi:hypothetical protein